MELQLAHSYLRKNSSAQFKFPNTELCYDFGDSAKMWKVINESMNKKSKTNTYPDFVEARNADGDTVRIRDKKEIANVMNKQFVEMGAKLAEKLPPTTTKFSEYLNSPSITSMFLQKASESEVGKHFHEINIK